MPAPSRRNPAALLMICAVPVAAMLSFAVQPMMGKRLLPIYGGSTGTWLGAMVFYQMALLLGYGWATWLLTRPLKFQQRATLVLAAAAIATFRLPGLDLAEGGIPRIVWILSLHSLPAMMLLFSVSPLMHGWLQRRGDQVPYHIYSVSNLGSLIGLVSYPFLIEPSVGIEFQRWIVHAGIVLVAALIGGAVVAGRSDANDCPPPASPHVSTPIRDILSWVGLSLATCVAMLGATDLLAAELGSSPLAWVGPFGAYLLSFTVVFSGKWKNWMTIAATMSLIVGLTAFMFYKGPGSGLLAGGAFVSMMAGVASACFVGNALLYRLRPAVSFGRYYLALAAGGVAGGLLVSVVLPHVLPRPVEFILASGLLLVLGVWTTVPRREPGALALAGALAIVPLIGFGGRTLRDENPDAEIRNFRNEYGHMFTRTSIAGAQSRVELVSATTVHGTQLRLDGNSARRPTTYYTEAGGAGRTILQMRASRPTMRIGVIGLGAGTLAAYGVAGDEFRFWDIDPKVIQIANTEFSYLKDTRARVEVIEADGRRGLASSNEDFDLIVVDAFSGDSVPAHLVTVEALKTYLERLAARKGVLVIHASSRYGAIFPVFSNTSLAAGRQALGVVTWMDVAGEKSDWDPISSEYVIIPPAELMDGIQALFPQSEDNGRVSRLIRVNPSKVPDPALVWTDDRHAAADVILLRTFLTWPGISP